jgi:signal transduction histidine kinase
VLAEPLLYRDRLLGVLALNNRGTSRRFTDRDAELLRLFAAQAAIAIENARLYEQVRRHAEDLERKVEERTREFQEANAHLRAANADLEAFSYSVSHDLRTPLLAIDGFSQLLARKYGAVLGAPGREYVQRVRDAVKRMEELVDALLGLARIAREPLHRESVDLSALAGAILRELSQHTRHRAVEIRIQDGLVVQGDARLLRRLLENLLGNAWKFTARTRHPRIEVGSLAGEGEPTVYYVRDNGAGFNIAEADKLFQLFQRLHGEEFPGTGIGLATVQRIVQRHGGRVWAEGAVDGGAVFFFTIGSA